MGSETKTMSYGGIMRSSHLAVGVAATFGLSVLQHKSVLESGLQPSTIAGEWQAATVGYLLAHPLESSDKTMLCNPITNTAANSESGRAVKFDTFKDLKNPWN